MAQQIKKLIKRAVRVAMPAPESSAAPVPANRPWSVADNATDNAWTIAAHGQTYRFFFITGCYKSGTHWVQNILNLHPAVNVKGEFHFETLQRGYEAMVNTHWYLSARPRLRPTADASYHDFVRRMMWSETRDKPGATWLGDRTPRLLNEVLPGAPVINIRRDGRDVMVSWNFHHLRAQRIENLLPQMRETAERIGPEFRDHPERFHAPGAGFLAEEWWFRHHARVWAGMITRELEEAPRMIERGTRLLRIAYEDIHADVQSARRQLFDHLGLRESEAAPLSHETRTLPGFEEESPTKFYRKGATGEWKDMFTDRQRQWFKEEAGAALIAAGYEKDGNW